jgi:hypothetical protein
MLKTEAFAVADDGRIDVLSIAVHQQAAKINWLVASLGVGSYVATDEVIDKLWAKHGGSARVIAVTIEETPL